jgi:ferrochelatase
MPPYDAFLLLSFGGPEGPDDVLPFLDNVLRGRDVPEQRKREVAERYWGMGGVSPLNAHNRALLEALRAELSSHGPQLPLYWGNRSWHPLLADTVRRMAADGVRRALAFVTSGFSCYSGCRQYLEDIERARVAVGPAAPRIDKLRAFYDHPGFVEPMVEGVSAALQRVPPQRRAEASLVFTAHSLPLAMAEACDYRAQLQEACRLVAARAGRGSWQLAYQSRSGPPQQPWLEPDILVHLGTLASQGATDVVVAPIGFVSDHMEVVYDLDREAAFRASELGLRLVRAATPGTHPLFVRMIRELIEERMSETPVRRALGRLGPAPDVCSEGCCLAGARRESWDRVGGR